MQGYVVVLGRRVVNNTAAYKVMRREGSGSDSALWGIIMVVADIDICGVSECSTIQR